MLISPQPRARAVSTASFMLLPSLLTLAEIATIAAHIATKAATTKIAASRKLVPKSGHTVHTEDFQDRGCEQKIQLSN